MVLFQIPNGSGGVEMGFVLSIWKGVKSPKLISTSCNVNSIMAFRAVTLDFDADGNLEARIVSIFV